MENTKTLNELCLKYPLTDKGPIKADGSPGHNYTSIYESYFFSLREKQIKILEIGFGGGDSLKLWEEYFPHAMIFCIDNNLSRIEEYGYKHRDRIQIFYGDQSNAESLISACNKTGTKEFDVIIDDGSHVENHIILTFQTLFESFLSPGGMYFIEDFSKPLDFKSQKIDKIVHEGELTIIQKKINS